MAIPWDRVTKELWCFPVPDRTSRTLIPIIKECVAAGARIYSDGWMSYNNLGEEGYDHVVVPRVNGFGSGTETTNGIESCWSELKRLTNHDQGIRVSESDPLQSLQEYINLGAWRRQFKREDLVEELVLAIKFSYF